MSELNISGFEELLTQLDELGDNAVIAAREGVDAGGQAVENSIKNSMLAMIDGEYSTGALYASISHTAHVKNQAAVGSFGVFKIDKELTMRGLNPKKAIGRPMLAYWFEFGIQPHSVKRGARTARQETMKSRARSAKNQDGTGHSGTAPKPFVTNGIDMGMTQFFDHFIERFNTVQVEKLK